MRDAISRQSAIEVGYKIVEELAESSLSVNDLKLWVEELFNAIPSEEGVVVSRCRDCIYYQRGSMFEKGYCDLYGRKVSVNHFCSKGERSEE